MPIPPFVVRTEIRGTSPGGEIWQTGLWFDLLGVPFTPTDLGNFLGNYAPTVTTWWNAIKSTIYNSFALTEIRGYYYATSGVHADFANVALLTANPGTQSSAGSPIDTSLVMSLRSARVGSSHRGRMYVPHHATVQPTGLQITSAVTTYVNATRAMLAAANLATGTVASVVSATLATVDHVVSVSADLKPDVQRRRQNRLNGGVPVSAVV
jgi:hypothetical protein